MAGEPDPKPQRRKKDRAARRRASIRADECVVCGRSAVSLNQHHILYGRDGRDDDERNLITVCGSGTTGCHELLHVGDREALERVGRAVLAAPEKMAFLAERLGQGARDYVRRRYGA